MNNNKKRNIFIYVSIIVLVCCILYYGARGTYTSYESNISGDASADIAGIKLKINGQDVMTGNSALNNNLLLYNVTWNSTHTREGKISPGSNGSLEIELDPTGSEVAIKYDFQFIDKTRDPDKLITFTNVTSSDSNVIRTGIDTYTGIITLDDIAAGKKIKVYIDFLFDNTVDIEGIEEDLQTYDDLFDIFFHAIQYTGENIDEYVPEEGGGE